MIHLSLNFVHDGMMPWDNMDVEEEVESFSWKKLHAKLFWDAIFNWVFELEESNSIKTLSFL